MNRIEVSLRRIIVGYRAISAVWLTVLAVIALVRDTADRPGLVVTTAAAVLLWSAITIWVSFRAAGRLRSRVFLLADLLLTTAVLVAPDAAGSADFYGGYPVSTVFLGVYALGMWGGAVTAAVVTAVAVWRALGPRSTEEVFALVTSIVVYPFIAVPATWAIGVLRRNDRLRREAEAALHRERADRIRAEERAEIAAHLHDSVLQTLALIQRDPHDADAVVAIARRQERDLRQWLYEDRTTDSHQFGEALADLVGELEDQFPVRIDAVVVGDAPLDPALEPLLGATREALVNAAKHSGADAVSVYAEIDATNASVFVRDRGAGFDPTAVSSDRKGIEESITGRMHRHGGTATVTSVPGAGTEVQLVVPRRAVGE